MSKAINEIKHKAETLTHLRDEISAIKEASATVLAEKELMREKTQTELLLLFKKEGLSSIKTDTGETCAVAVRKGLEVTSEAHALKWAIEARAVSINKILAKQKLEMVIKSNGDLPDGFAYKEVEYISLRKPKPTGKADVASIIPGNDN